MTKRPITNVAASVRDRLLNRSRQTGEDFQFLLQRYAAERLLYRLGQSAHRARFVLKGAMLFALWGGLVYRPTRDLDFTSYGNSDADSVVATFKEVCTISVPDDGLVFDAATVTAAPVRDEAEYGGLRVRLRAMLGNARIEMQIDIGGYHFLWVYYQPCRTTWDIDLPTLDRHRDAAITSLIASLCCRSCRAAAGEPAPTVAAVPAAMRPLPSTVRGSVENPPRKRQRALLVPKLGRSSLLFDAMLR